MGQTTVNRGQAKLPKFVYHPSFDEPDAANQYAEECALGDPAEFDRQHMPDDVTRDNAKRMHYAAWRASLAQSWKQIEKWTHSYYRLRDRVVVGNRKLVYRAVRKRMATSNRTDDLIGECQLVLIHAVAAYNPWLGIRFSTYAFTCLIRALGRLSQRIAADWLSRSVPIDRVADTTGSEDDEPRTSAFPSLDSYFHADHPLLSPREKTVLRLRFGTNAASEPPTLEMVGRNLGLSKERVRQVQALAITKLRAALSDETQK
jgi:RNA polymerase sigma factor (sigma-70 family)